MCTKSVLPVGQLNIGRRLEKPRHTCSSPQPKHLQSQFAQSPIVYIDRRWRRFPTLFSPILQLLFTISLRPTISILILLITTVMMLSQRLSRNLTIRALLPNHPRLHLSAMLTLPSRHMVEAHRNKLMGLEHRLRGRRRDKRHASRSRTGVLLPVVVSGAVVAARTWAHER